MEQVGKYYDWLWGTLSDLFSMAFYTSVRVFCVCSQVSQQ